MPLREKTKSGNAERGAPVALTPSQVLESEIIPLGKNSLYQAIATGEIPSVRIGRKILIPAAPLARMFGLDLDDLDVT